MRVGRAFRVVVLALFLWIVGIPTGLPIVGAVDGGDEPRPQLAALAGSGDTSHYVDGQGIEVWGVYDGYDLDQYLFRSGSPINFSIDLDRDFGPVDGDGHPIVTNELYGSTTKLTLRAEDVDEDYAGTDFEPEVDTVWVNGIELNGFLSGANNQWSISTFDVPASILRLPTSANPNGTNQIEVRVDTANAGPDVWAVEIDWAELRTGFPATQATTFLHGILGQPQPNGSNSISAAQDFFVNEYPILTDRTANPTLADDMTIQERAEAVVGEIQDLAISSGAPRVNLVSHSLGGLVGRQLAWDHPHLVDDLAMMSTPNGGVPNAGLLCALITGLGASGGGGFFLPTQHQCGGADTLHQMSESYVTGTFNEVVRDKLSTTYLALASNADELISPDSAEYLSRDNPDHPGLHETRPRYEVEHGALVQAGSPTFPDILCEPTMYPDADVCGESAASLLSTPASARAETLIKAQTVTVPAGATLPIPLTFGGAQLATVEIAAASLQGLSATFSGATFSAGLLVGLVPSLSATISSPIDGTLDVTNTGTAPVHLDVLTFTDSSRQLTAEAAIVPGVVTLSAVLTEAGPTETVVARIVGDGGVVVREATLAPQGGGLYRASVAAPPPGMYAIAGEAMGSAPRVAHNTLYVPVGGVSFGSGFGEATVGRGDGMIDQLVLSPTVTVTQNATYAVSADLRSSGGALVATAGTVATLSAGTHVIELAFEGKSIWESGVSGPYVLANVVVARHDSLGLEAEVPSLGSTSAYSVYDFRHDPVVFDPDGFSDAAVDTDGNGSIDALSVVGSIAVDVGGAYVINAKLLAPDGSEISQSQQTTQLVAGTNSVELLFDGEAIVSSGKDGPYVVADLSAYRSATADHVGYLITAHTTAAYTIADFGGSSGVMAWGRAEALGVATTETCPDGPCSTSPVSVPIPGGAIAIASGSSHTLAIDTEGRVWTWGTNGVGQLGDGTNTTRLQPAMLSSLSGVVAVASGGTYSVALKNDGTVWSWGQNGHGQLGDGTTTNRNVPVRAGSLSGVVAIDASSNHTLAVKADGTVWAWGSNVSGQLGDGTKQNRSVPVRATVISGVTAVSAQITTSYALKADGTVWNWPDGGNAKRAVKVVGLPQIVQLEAAHGGSCCWRMALAADGTVWTWGSNSHGQLGDGTYVSHGPAQVPSLTGVAAIAAGSFHALALRSDGTIWAWGDNQYGQITTTCCPNGQTTPMQIASMPTAQSIAAGQSASFALLGGP